MEIVAVSSVYCLSHSKTLRCELREKNVFLSQGFTRSVIKHNTVISCFRPLHCCFSLFRFYFIFIARAS